MHTKFWFESLNRKDHSEDWEGNIRKYLGDVGSEGVQWVNLPLNRDCWWALVDVVMNHRVPYKTEYLLTG